MINFCHISPTAYLPMFTHTNGAHLLLAHLVESDPQYREYYATLDDGKPKILDNSAFEMFKRGEPMYSSSKLIDMGKACKADYIVMSDYPKEKWRKTQSKAMEMAPELKDAGFKTFYVPQGQLGDLDGVLKSFDWALGQKEIDLIGVSILTCPIAFGVNETRYADGSKDTAYKLQRFLSRWKLLCELRKAGLLTEHAKKRFHCLGMMDGPNEVELLIGSGFEPFIYSWDSSAAVWLGLQSRKFDNSPSGLRDGKFEKEVDFDHDTATAASIACVLSNVDYINKLCHV